MRFFVLSLTLVTLCSLSGCDVRIVTYQQPRQRVEAVTDEPDIEVVQEGAMCEGVIVTEPPVVEEYVFIGGQYYYWHPSHRRWVSAHRGYGWHPPRSSRVTQLRNLHEHPMYAHPNNRPDTPAHKGKPKKKKKDDKK